MRILVGFLSACLAAAPLFAAADISVTAAGAFKLSGVEVPATAAASVPAAIGDEITTSDASAVIRFGSEGVVTLDPRSSVKLEQGEGYILVRLVAGSLSYKLSAESKIRVFNKNQAADPPLEGAIAVEKSHKLVYLAAVGGAAAVITTVAVSTKSKNCPPTSNGINCR